MKTRLAAGCAVILGILAAPAQAVPMLSFSIDGNTFTQPFSISNSSDAGERVTRFQLDIAPTNTCFDTVSLSGDNVSPCQRLNNNGVPFTPVGGDAATTGLVTPVVLPDGATLLDISFTDFDAGETFRWDVDIDHDDGGSTVNGNELIGALATIDFSDGQRLLGVLAAVPGNDDASTFTVTGITTTPTVPAPLTLSLVLLGLLSVLGRRRVRAAA